MVAIVDYGSGNLRSVYNAFRYLGIDAKIADSAELLKHASKVVLPGVGSSRDAMEGLKKRELIEPIFEAVKAGKPFLGICLGLQLLFEKSEESGGCNCLGMVKGEVKLFPSRGLKVPQIGWNTIKFAKKNCPIFDGIKDESYFYFVHSYYCLNEEKGKESASTDYGITYTSALWRDNIFAVQFHPERSQANGLKLLENFIKL